MQVRVSLATLALLLPLLAAPLQLAQAGEFRVQVAQVPDLKAVFGQVEGRDVIQARARLGGTIVSLAVEEGTAVNAGDVIATVVDDKLALQLDAVDARLKALDAELANATTELGRARRLAQTGIAPRTKVDAQQTQVDVLTNQIAAAKAERAVLVQQGDEGRVLAPAPGRVLSVPVTKGSVIMPGEAVARIASGGYFLRLSLPERHAAQIKQGDTVRVGPRGMAGATAVSGREGTVVKVYPELQAGRVLADVEVDGLGDFFAGERTLVWIPVATRQQIGVPPAAVSQRSGVDYVKVKVASGDVDVAVITGARYPTADGERVEILSGLADGDVVVTP